jgi:branched-chain amino acid transport system ATP-binding protein
MLAENKLCQEAVSILEDLNIESILHYEAASISRGDKKGLESAMSLIQKPKLLLLGEIAAKM